MDCEYYTDGEWQPGDASLYIETSKNQDAIDSVDPNFVFIVTELDSGRRLLVPRTEVKLKEVW